MTTIIKPDFKLTSPNTNSLQPDTLWWLWLQMKRIHPKVRLGGIYANKKGFHNTGNKNKSTWPGEYSTHDSINRHGLGMTKASAIDFTFPDAQAGDYGSIKLFTQRLVHSSLDDNDPRLGMFVFEFFGQSDNDRTVEGYDEYHERSVSADSSHLWHLHISVVRSLLDSWWGVWALFTVLDGWTTKQWCDSLPAGTSAPKPKPASSSAASTKIPVVRNGSRTLSYTRGKPFMTGTDVKFVQTWIGPVKMGKADGIAGPKFTAGVKWYQKMRGITSDGIVGPKTWAQMGIK